MMKILATWWTRPIGRKEAIPHFFRFFLYLFGIFAKTSGCISLYALFLKNSSMNHTEI